MRVLHTPAEWIDDGMLELRKRIFDLNRQQTERNVSTRIIKKPVIQLLLFEDAWTDDDNDDKTRDNQGHRNKRYQEDAASASGKFASDDPVLNS